MSLDIGNILGNAPQGLAGKVNVYFEDEKSPVSSGLAQLNELIGFPYGLKIDWRERTPSII